MTNDVLKDLLEIRNWLGRNCPWMLMTLMRIEDEFFAMHCKVIELENENHRLKGLLHRGTRVAIPPFIKAEDA